MEPLVSLCLVWSTKPILTVIHRGCVSGLKVTNLQESISDGGDEYKWEMIDGWEDLE